jgi:exopolysaccharide biosynthesis protein
MNETASLMQSIGCIHAINLDGGGSSCLLVNGKVVNSPSGITMRKVTNAIVITSKTKIKKSKR